MAPRANWKGYLRLSLVSCPVALFPASTLSEKVHFHRINKQTGNRLKQQNVDAETGDVVDREDIGRGYEFSKGQYLEVEDDELEQVKIESTRTIDIDQFVERAEIDDRYLNAPYYIAPDGKVGLEAFAVIRDTIEELGMVALGRVVLTRREHVIAIQPRGKGLQATTLRYPYEVRSEEAYFEDIPAVKLPKEMRDLAAHIVKTKTGHFDPSTFTDRYEDALVDLLKRKQAGKPLPKVKEEEEPRVINLMDALRRSVEGARGSGSGSGSGRAPARRGSTKAKKPARSAARGGGKAKKAG